MSEDDARADVHAGFLTECDELLEVIQDGLVAIDTEQSTVETVHDLFRAVHSIKGGAAAFDYEGIVRFAHGFETALVGLRDEETAHGRASDPQILRYLFKSADGLADLVTAARTGVATPEDAGQAALDELIRLTNPAIVDAIVQTKPVETARYAITLTPDADAYRFEIDLMPALRALSDLGPVCSRICHEDTAEAPPNLPLLTEYDPASPHLAWHLTIETAAPSHSITDILDPIAPLYPYQIAHIGGDNLTDQPASDTQDAAQTDGLGLFTPLPSQVKRSTLRVDLTRIEMLVNQVGEMVIAQSMLAQSLEDSDVARSDPILTRFEELRRLTQDIQDSVVMIRAQPVKTLFQRMSRVLRDAAEDQGKSVQLRYDGEETEIDKLVLERLVDPLTHMIRNSVVHGIESPETRQKSGKPETGTVRLSASHRSGRVIVELTDDGAGIDQAKVLERAVHAGLITEGTIPSDEDVQDFLFHPGFSTSNEVSDLAGRGVGLDVVRSTIASMGGRLTLSSTPGKGMALSLSLPLTLAVLDGLVVQTAGETTVLPLNSVRETLTIDPDNIHLLGAKTPMIKLRGVAVPLHDFGATLGLRSKIQPDQGTSGLLIDTNDGNEIVLRVDRIVDQRQIVIKGLPDTISGVAGMAGATILGDGQVALIIDPADLIQSQISPTRLLAPSPYNTKRHSYEI